MKQLLEEEGANFLGVLISNNYNKTRVFKIICKKVV